MPSDNEIKGDDNLLHSPDKKRIKPGTPTKPIQIGHEKVSTNRSQTQTTPLITSTSSNSPGKSYPLWVADAGSSPAKFVSIEDLIKMNDSIEKMAIVHQIAIEPKCTVEDLKPKDPLYEQVKSNMHKAYWDMLRESLTKESPNNEDALSLLMDLKKMITDHLETANLKNAMSAVDEALDIDHLRHMLKNGVCNLSEVLHSVLSILEKLCAPVRDEFVAKLKQEEDIVQLFRGMFNLVEFMHLDMANFTLTQNRQLIGSYSAKIEFDEFMKLLEIDKAAADNTRLWLKKILTDFVANRSRSNNTESASSSSSADELSELSRGDVNEMIVKFYLQLLTTTSTPRWRQQFPETIKLDQARIGDLGNKLLQLELTVAAIFMTSNLAGNSIPQTFKPELKRDLLVILNDVDWRNYAEKLQNVALQCDQKCRELIGDGWTAERSTMLKQQLLAIADPNESVRKIAGDRIHGFIHQTLRQSSEPLRIPPGLGVVQTELASLTSRFYAIAVHNWNAFGRFYGQILDDEFNKLQRNQQKANEDEANK